MHLWEHQDGIFFSNGCFSPNYDLEGISAKLDFLEEEVVPILVGLGWITMNLYE